MADDFFLCEICAMVFDQRASEARCPKILPSCGHTVCLQCCVQLPVLDGGFLCPLCRTPCFVPAHRLPCNIKLMSAVEARAQRGAAPPRAVASSAQPSAGPPDRPKYEYVVTPRTAAAQAAPAHSVGAIFMGTFELAAALPRAHSAVASVAPAAPNTSRAPAGAAPRGPSGVPHAHGASAPAMPRAPAAAPARPPSAMAGVVARPAVAPAQPPAPAARVFHHFTVTVFDSDNCTLGTIRVGRGQQVSVGRAASECDLPINRPYLARHHYEFRMAPHDGALYAIDCSDGSLGVTEDVLHRRRLQPVRFLLPFALPH